MPTKYAVRLSEGERARLRTLIGRGIAPARQLTRARILLKANQGDGGPGWADAAIAAALEVHPATVRRVRQTYVEVGLDTALVRKTPDRVYPHRLDGAGEAHRLALACSAPPEGQTRWTLRLLATELVRLEMVETVSYETVRRTVKQTTSSRICRSNGVSHRTPTPSSSGTWKTSWMGTRVRMTRVVPKCVWMKPVDKC